MSKLGSLKRDRSEVESRGAQKENVGKNSHFHCNSQVVGLNDWGSSPSYYSIGVRVCGIFQSEDNYFLTIEELLSGASEAQEQGDDTDIYI